MKLRVNPILAIALLASAQVGMADDKAAYPNEKSAAFVIQNLDITSLPSDFRPKKEKGKKTFTDYSFTTQKLNDNEALIEAPGNVRSLSIKVLEVSASGIYACVAEPAQDGSTPRVQNVIRLQRKDSDNLLKGRLTWKNFSSCPTIEDESTATSSID